MGHAFNITVNSNAIIGNNCNLHKGCLIGQENRGIRKGAPILGNCVWVGINASIVGKVKIGDDVLIAPNSYVNIDVIYIDNNVAYHVVREDEKRDALEEIKI